MCVTGASNFLGTKPPLDRDPPDRRGRRVPAPDGASGSLLLVDAAQLAPTSVIDVLALEVDYLAFSFHKLLAPFGVGVLYAREPLLERSLPFLYGGDMIAEGGCPRTTSDYNQLPWKYAAGTPNVLGVIASRAGAPAPGRPRARPGRTVVRAARDRWPAADVEAAMDLVHDHVRGLTDGALDRAQDPPAPGLRTAARACRRSPLLAFTVPDRAPRALASALDEHGVEARAGCHCATLAHRDLGLSRRAPAGSASRRTPTSATSTAP